MFNDISQQVLGNYIDPNTKQEKMLFQINRVEDVLVTEDEENNSLDYFLPTSVDSLTNAKSVKPFKMLRQSEGVLTEKEKNAFGVSEM